MRAIAAKTVVSLREKPTEQVCLDDELLYGMTAEILEEVPALQEGAFSEDIGDRKRRPVSEAEPDIGSEGRTVIQTEPVPGSTETKWVRIRTEYRYEAYCKKEDLLTDEGRVNRWEHGDIRTVMRPYVDVLSEPKVQGLCMESVPMGGRLLLIGQMPEHEGWVEVELADGRKGYTRESFLGVCHRQPFTEDEEVFRSRLVELAKNYMGTQYRWGGKSPLGIDCSGLTSMCYMLCGVYIYRNARMKEGFPIKEIQEKDMKPGDLLFFPGHIAMYIGEERYIHSTGKSGSDGVVINSLNPNHADFRQDLRESLEQVGSMFVSKL